MILCSPMHASKHCETRGVRRTDRSPSDPELAIGRPALLRWHFWQLGALAVRTVERTRPVAPLASVHDTARIRTRQAAVERDPPPVLHIGARDRAAAPSEGGVNLRARVSLRAIAGVRRTPSQNMLVVRS